MKRFLALVLGLALCLSGCSKGPRQTQYTATFLDVFDTVTTVVGRAESQEAFEAVAQQIHDGLLRYHQLFDIYNEYPGLTNLKTVNDRAGTAPVQADPEILALLSDCKTYYEATQGRVNAAMGSVLTLWHQAREGGTALPEAAALEEAVLHTAMESLVLDKEKGTVAFSDPRLLLDVGAIAKGWAAQRVCQQAPAGLLISVGGNVCATGPKGENTPWVVGIQDPDGGDYLHTLFLSKGSIVTSGDYQRTYTVDGQQYHHIIDPDTLYPGRLWRAVTVVCADSGLADALSTALFLLPQAEGQALLDRYGAQAMWMDGSGKLTYSPGFSELIKR